MKYPNLHTGTFAGEIGVGYELDKISTMYEKNVITIISVNTTGIIGVEAKARNNTNYEDVIDGEIPLPDCRTLTITGTALSALRFTNSETSPFAVTVEQFNPVEIVAR